MLIFAIVYYVSFENNLGLGKISKKVPPGNFPGENPDSAEKNRECGVPRGAYHGGATPGNSGEENGLFCQAPFHIVFLPPPKKHPGG
jgi:hypothetical protein